MKIWIDDIRPAPHGFYHMYSVNQAKEFIKMVEFCDNHTFNLDDDSFKIDIIDMDHDAGDFSYDGGDYIRLLDWFEETGRNYPIKIHSMNPVGIENMKRIIQKNNWKTE